MTYENPEVPHEVNVSRDSAIAEFLRLAAALALLVALVTAAIFLFGGWLARHVPFAMEKSWVGETVLGIDVEVSDRDAARGPAIERYLQQLTDRLAARMSLPRDMVITAHYTELDVPNAFATLGGHIVVTSGLYGRLPSENALAMVIAHEIGHVRARDPIAGVGSAAMLALLVTAVSGDAGSLAGPIATVVQRGYSRDAERSADAAAIAALKAEYGHAGGAAAVFEILADLATTDDQRVPGFLSTHPADAERIARLRAAAAGWDPNAKPLRPIQVAIESLRGVR